MASADLRFDIRTPREARSQWHQIGSPQVRRASFLPVHRIYLSDSCMSIGHWVFWLPHPSEPPHIRFLFVEHAFCYQLPPDLVLPLHPCRVANSSPHRASSGFAPYRSAPCWAHQQKRPSKKFPSPRGVCVSCNPAGLQINTETYFSVTSALSLRTWKPSSVTIRPRTSVSSAGRAKVLVTASATGSISTITLKFLLTA